MTKKLIKKNDENLIIYISYELLQISDWLSEHQCTETFYIEQLLRQYKVSNINVNNLIEIINNDQKIVNDKIITSITTEVITKLAEFLNEHHDDIIDNIKEILYQAYFQEAKKIINYADYGINDLNTLLDRASVLDISSALLNDDIGEYLTSNGSVFYNFIAKLGKFLDIKTNIYEVNLEQILSMESWYKNWFSDIEKNITSIIGD